MGQAAESESECFALSGSYSENIKIDSKTSSRTFSNLDKCLNESLALLSVRGDHRNKDYTKTVADLVPITFGRLNLSRGKPQPKNIKILLDSGSTGTLMCENLAKKLKVKKSSSTFEWTTLAGPVKTATTAKVEFSLPEFHDDKLIEWKVHLAKN